MKCAICDLQDKKLTLEALKKHKEPNIFHDIPEAVASFHASNGMMIYICSQHVRADRLVLDDIVTKDEWPE